MSVISDEHVDALRAWVVDGDPAPSRSLLGSDTARRGVLLLVNGLFVRLALDRFDDACLSDVIDFVAEVRTRAPEMVDWLNPGSAECLLLWIAQDDVTFFDHVEPMDRFATMYRLIYLLACDLDNQDLLNRYLSEEQTLANRRAENESRQQ